MGDQPPESRCDRGGLTRRSVLRWAGLGLFTLAGRVGRAAPKADEYAVMATFMLQFAQFTTWPEAAVEGSRSSPLVVVAGGDPFGAKLDEVFRGERLWGRSYGVKRCRPSEVPQEATLLFLGEMEEELLRGLLARVAAQPTLTFSARERFCAIGGMVTFRVEHGKVAFEINREAVARSRLTLHSRLLNVARIYREEAEP